MRKLEDVMAEYSSYHRDKRNQATHFVGVPMIVFAILILLGHLRFGDVAGVPITAASLMYAVLAVYYVRLDMVLGVTLVAIMLPFFVVSEWILAQGITVSMTSFGVLFVVGWIIQLVGHWFEGNKPNLTSNLLQVFAAPIFLVAEVFFARGWKQDLYAAVERKVLTGQIELRGKSSGGMPAE